ncbi:protein-tyrosine-phosphatase [Flavobacteriaceae bacterium TK19130]|nr:protein-tyrosine-phosphatase [Thermobacterium salinum]
MFLTLKETIDRLEISTISDERIELLDPIAAKWSDILSNEGRLNIIFICTHNSRRSHLAQLWAQAISIYFGIEGIQTYSGGTEATRVYPTVLEILEVQGFEMLRLSQEDNPVYALKYGDTEVPSIAFSKEYGHDFNPSHGFSAIMTCTEADGGCPFVAGASSRFSLPYEDPKTSDGSSEELETYTERSLQIATELKYIFQKIKKTV